MKRFFAIAKKIREKAGKSITLIHLFECFAEELGSEGSTDLTLYHSARKLIIESERCIYMATLFAIDRVRR